jgi:hypothetical protein
MAVITETVNPGDVISSALMKKIIDLLNAHETSLGGGGGGIVVPNLFGQTLNDARLALQLQQLTLGTVVDTGGAVINPLAVSSQQRMVLNQVPVSGSQTVTGGSVNLVVAGQSSGSPAPAPAAPVINLLLPSSVRAGNTLEIRGSGFAGVTSVVTFGGINGVVQATSNQTRIFVLVPTGIPGAPALPGDPATPGIALRVTNPDSQFVNSTVTLLPPLTSPLAISNIAPDPGQMGSSVVITGTGFLTTLNQNVVSFGTLTATPTLATPTQLTVTIPNGIPGLSGPGDSTSVNVTVTRTTDGEVSNVQSLSVDF